MIHLELSNFSAFTFCDINRKFSLIKSYLKLVKTAAIVSRQFRIKMAHHVSEFWRETTTAIFTSAQ
jgi:hypothetical protein